LAVNRYQGEQQLAQARLRAALDDDARDGALAVRETLAMNAASLQSLARRWPSTAAATRALTEQIKAQQAALPLPAKVNARDARDARVPLPSPAIQGPLGVYYYDHVEEMEKARGLTAAPLPAYDGDTGLLLYEAMNLADGRRSVGDIRDILSGRYAPVPQALLAAHFERLAAAGILRWQ
jgi:hypothetical protein